MVHEALRSLEQSPDISLEAATQVKWNRQNEHILASSHANNVLIWDRRVCSR